MQKITILLAKAGNIGERFGSRQDRQQAQKQHLIKRVNHLRRLPDVRKGLRQAYNDSQV